MSKTDTVARFSLIFARKIHFSENTSEQISARIFVKNWWPKPLIVEDYDTVRRIWKVECTGQRQVSTWPS